MHFAHPDNLYLLLLLVPMVLALAGYFWWKRRLAARVGHSHLIRAMAARHSNRRQVARGILVICAAALLCVAAAQPQWGQDDRTIKRFGVDVVFALDLSNSMLAEDIPPNRMKAAKDEIETTLTTLAGDRVGLVVFTAISFAQSPLTTDYGAIRFYLDKLEAGQMPVGGTSLGQAILDSVELLTGEKPDGESEDDEAQDSAAKTDRAKNQVIVLITDGEDHESSPIEAARKARERGIHVVTVGLGSPDGSRIPIHGDNGQLKGYKRNQKGELVYTKLDEKTLQKIAAESGGTYLRYSGEHSVVNGLQEYIKRLEKSELETMLRKRYKDRFMYFVAPALFLLLIALFMGERRRKPKGAPSRTDRQMSDSKTAGSKKAGSKATSSTLLVLLLLTVLLLTVGSVGCDGAFRDTVEEVDTANELISAQKYQEALEKYREAETKVPASPELHYNRGIALLGAEEFDKARESFARALETNDKTLRFDALFNLGLALAGQEKWKEAYETYKEALRVELDANGSAQEQKANQTRLEQARHNLEVVFRKLFPPCSELEDDLEDNDEPEAASQLEKLQKDDLALCGLDDDWFVIPAMVGTSVSVDADFSVLREEPDPEHVFLPRHQDLQIAVFDAAGNEVLAVDQGSPETFDPDTKRTSRSIEKFTVTEQMVAGGNGHLLLKVSATDQREFSYDVNVTAIPPCRALEDDHEQNDTPQTARQLEAPNNQLHICPSDDDWFEVELELGDTLFVDLKASEDRERERAPELSMEVVRKATGKVVASGKRDAPYITAGVHNVMEPGAYLVRVFGATDDEQGPYSLDIYQYAPCVVGDDRFEENDSAQQAAGLDPNAPAHRYLRICDSDRDFFRLPAPKEEQDAQKAPAASDDNKTEVAWGLTAIADQTVGDRTPGGRSAPSGSDSSADHAPEPPRLDLMSASGDQIIAEGVVPEIIETPGNDQQNQQNQPAPPRADRIVRHDNKDKEELLLRVEGAQSFYHLTQLNPQNQQQNDENKDNQEKKDDQKKKDDQNKDDQEEKDEQEKKDDQEKQDEQNKDDQQKKDDQKKKDDQNKDDQEKQDDQKDKNKKKDARRPEPAKKDPEQQRTEDILRALEETDDNFQMKKALEDMPKRYIEKDW